MCLTLSSQKRADYLRKHNIFYHIGEKCSTMFRIIPLYPELISFGNNVRIAARVQLITHDGIHRVVNKMDKNLKITEYIGCIEIKDNCFIGSDSTILPNVSIGPNVIVGAGSLVNKNLPEGGVYAGVPARYICSFDEFLQKRKSFPEIKIKKSSNGCLSAQTIEDCWKRFRDINSESQMTNNQK